MACLFDCLLRKARKVDLGDQADLRLISASRQVRKVDLSDQADLRLIFPLRQV